MGIFLLGRNLTLANKQIPLGVAGMDSCFIFVGVSMAKPGIRLLFPWTITFTPNCLSSPMCVNG